MTDFWWWIIPLMKTGFLCAVLSFAVRTISAAFGVKRRSPYYISLVLYTPLVVSGLSVIAWCMWGVLYSIWK